MEGEVVRQEGRVAAGPERSGPVPVFSGIPVRFRRPDHDPVPIRFRSGLASIVPGKPEFIYV